jgi:hypothetical protein
MKIRFYLSVSLCKRLLNLKLGSGSEISWKSCVRKIEAIRKIDIASKDDKKKERGLKLQGMDMMRSIYTLVVTLKKNTYEILQKCACSIIKRTGVALLRI